MEGSGDDDHFIGDFYWRLLLEQDGPQDAKEGYGGAQFRLFERNELRNCRLRPLLRDARKSCLQYNDAANKGDSRLESKNT